MQLQIIKGHFTVLSHFGTVDHKGLFLSCTVSTSYIRKINTSIGFSCMKRVMTSMTEDRRNGKVQRSHLHAKGTFHCIIWWSYYVSLSL